MGAIADGPEEFIKLLNDTMNSNNVCSLRVEKTI